MSVPTPTPAYSPSDTKTPTLAAVMIVTTVLALVSFGMRMYVRLRIVRSLGWDDYTMFGAIFFALVVVVFESMALSYGIGTHKVFLEPEAAYNASMWATLTITPNVLATVCARISLCLLMMRIVDGMRLHAIFLWLVIVGTGITGIITCLNTYTACQPVAKIWDQSIKGVCNPERRAAIGMMQSVWTIGSDWLVALFPLLFLRKLQMAIRTKIALGLVMGLGFLIGVIVLLKTLKVGALFSRIDQTYDGADLATWSMVEQNIGIFLVNMPAIRPLFARMFAVVIRKTTHSGGGGVSQRYRADGYKLNNVDNMPWSTGPKGSHNGHDTIVTVTAGGAKDDNGSESSLVRDKDLDGITKTVAVSQYDYSTPAGHHPFKGGGGLGYAL